MKKHLALLLFTPLLPVFIIAQESDWKKAGLKGRVASVKLMTEDYDKAGKAAVRNSEVYNYNGTGALTGELTVNDETMDFVSQKKYEYSNGLLIKTSRDIKISILAGVEEQQYSYDQNKKLTGIRTLKAETGKVPVKTASKKTFSYDVAGNCTEEKTVDYDYNNMENIVRYSYDAAGRKTRTEYIRNGKSWQLADYTYDKNNHLQTETTSDESGKPKSSLAYQYDAAGHIKRTEALEYNYPEPTVYSRSITNNMYIDDRMIETYTEKDGKRVFKASWQYDGFDKQGNWLTRKHFINDKLDRVEKRRISYF